MTDPRLETAMAALVNVAVRRGAWLCEGQRSPSRPREAARLALELEQAKQELRALFFERVHLREVGLEGSPILERVR